MKRNLESPMFKHCFQQWEQSTLKEKISKATTKEEKAEVNQILNTSILHYFPSG